MLQCNYRLLVESLQLKFENSGRMAMLYTIITSLFALVALLGSVTLIILATKSKKWAVFYYSAASLVFSLSIYIFLGTEGFMRVGNAITSRPIGVEPDIAVAFFVALSIILFVLGLIKAGLIKIPKKPKTGSNAGGSS